MLCKIANCSQMYQSTVQTIHSFLVKHVVEIELKVGDIDVLDGVSGSPFSNVVLVLSPKSNLSPIPLDIKVFSDSFGGLSVIHPKIGSVSVKLSF